MMENILFFDLEVDRKSHRIADIGSVCANHEFHGVSLKEFQNILSRYDILCGHNIIRHDLEILRKAGLEKALHGKTFIDTLYLSALLFADGYFGPF